MAPLRALLVLGSLGLALGQTTCPEISCPAPAPPSPKPQPLGCEGVAVPEFTPTLCPLGSAASGYSQCEVPMGTNPNRRGCNFKIKELTMSSQEIYLKVRPLPPPQPTAA
jgi:hypothetical protein